MTEYGRLLPSEFVPQLREQVATIKVEGGIKDYELPDINEELVGFDYFTGGASEDPQLLKKFNDLTKEQALLKEEHKSNIKELSTKVEEMELSLKLKADKIAELLKTLQTKDTDFIK